jgi:PhnB protein
MTIKNAAAALEFYKNAFGATEIDRLTLPDGRVGHAEIGLGDSMIMLADEFPEYRGKGAGDAWRIAGHPPSLC